MTNYTTSTPVTSTVEDIYGLLGVGTSNTGKLLNPTALISSAIGSLTVADTSQIDLSYTGGQLSGTIVNGSIGTTQLSSGVNTSLGLANTAVQPAALTSYLPLSGGALTGAVTSTSSISSRQSANTVQFLVASGTAQTIDWNNGGSINLDLSSASGNVTLTLQNPVSGATYRIRVQQGGTVRNLIFPASTVQPGGGGTTYTGIAGTDLLTVYYNGSAYLVQSALNSGFTLSAASIAAAYLALAGGTMTGNLNLPSLNGGQLAGMRNKIINGGMNIAQRGTSFAAITSGEYSLDRWKYINSSAVVITASQQSDAPSSGGFQSSLRLAVTTADASIAVSDLSLIAQIIEGFNVRDLIGRTFALSFWVRSSKTGTHCISFSNSVSDRTYVAEYTISSANTWEYKTVTVSSGLITAGTWDWTNGVGLQVRFALAAGSTFQTTAGAWQTGNFLATSNQVNCLDTVGNTFAITGVQLEVGSVATPFEHRPYGTELALCQRYYAKNAQISGIWCDGTSMRFIDFYKVTMRATPAVAIIDSNVYHEWWNAVGYTGISSVGVAGGNNASIDVQVSSSSNRGRSYGNLAMLAANALSYSAEL